MGVATSRVAAPPTSVIDVELAGENAFATERITESPVITASRLLYHHGEAKYQIYFWLVH
jgi:hypothetical protein